MTFRQVLAIVWRRRLLAAVTTLLVILAAIVYARTAPVLYASTTTLRYSPAGTATLNGGSNYGSINLDLDPDYIVSPTLLTQVSKSLDDDPDALQAALSTVLDQDLRTTRLQLTATGYSVTQAKDRANAVADAFIKHLEDQLDAGLANLKKELARQQKTQSDSLKILQKRPGDQLASANFSSSMSRISAIQAEISTIEDNGAPVAVLRAARDGSRQGVSFLTIMLIGMVSGLLAGAGISLIRDQFDEHLRSTEDVEEVIGDHVIGDIALVPRRQLTLAPLPAASRLPTPLNESVRGLRTSLEVLFPTRHVAVVMTSAEPGEGKTFVSANLAVAMARAGRSVILIEGDLRRPRLGMYFDMPEGARGFAELIAADATSEEISSALIDTPYRGLRLIAAGSSDSEPADLLAGDTLAGVLHRVRGLADFVLLDSPPGLALTDAAILGREADGVVIVTALHRTRGSALRGTLQILNANRVNIVGTVVNRSKRATVRSYSHYYQHPGPPSDSGLPPDGGNLVEGVDEVAKPVSDSDDADVATETSATLRAPEHQGSSGDTGSHATTAASDSPNGSESVIEHPSDERARNDDGEFEDAMSKASAPNDIPTDPDTNSVIAAPSESAVTPSDEHN